VHQPECRTPQNLMTQNYKYWVSLLLSYFAMNLDYHVLPNCRNDSVMSSPKNRKKITIYFLLSCLCRGTTCKNWLLLEQFSILISCTLLKSEHFWSAVSIYKLHFGLKTNSGFASWVQSRGGGRRITGRRSRGKIRLYFLLYLLLACVALILFSFLITSKIIF